MSEELATQESTESNETPQEVTETVDNSKPSKPSGYDPVSLDDLPPEKARQIQDRMDYFYRQVKDNQRSLSEFRSIASEQAQIIEELRSGVGAVVDHLKTEKLSETENSLRQQLKGAFESGEFDKFLAIQEKLLDLKVKKNLDIDKKPAPKQEQRKAPNSAADIANEAANYGDLAPDEVMYIEQWSNERDERGQMLRPWTVNKNPENPDPDFVYAALQANKIAQENPHFNARQILGELDKIMNTKKPGGQAVLGGNLTLPKKSVKMSLTDNQKRIAVKSKFAGPGKSDAEHIEAYRKQIEAVKGAAK